MPLSETALEAALSPATSEIFLECLTIEHPSITDIMLVNDKQDLTRAAGIFVAFPFSVRLHARSEERITEAQIVADNVDQRIIQNLRGLSHGATAIYEVVLRDTPNVIEQGPFTFEVQSYTADVGTVSLQIGFALSFLNEAYPRGQFSPGNSTVQS